MRFKRSVETFYGKSDNDYPIFGVAIVYERDTKGVWFSLYIGR
jgi:hypothetical protein